MLQTNLFCFVFLPISISIEWEINWWESQLIGFNLSLTDFELN